MSFGRNDLTGTGYDTPGLYGNDGGYGMSGAARDPSYGGGGYDGHGHGHHDEARPGPGGTYYDLYDEQWFDADGREITEDEALG